VSARLRSLSPRAVVAVAALAVLLYAVVLWFLVVSPKRADAAEAKDEVAAAELRLAEARAAGSRPSGTSATVTDVFRLTKAMPSSLGQPGLIFELSRLAKRSGVELRSIAPKDLVVAEGGPSLVPVTVTVGGSYAQITKFLRQIRVLVRVRNGKILVAGRLLSVQSVSLVESPTERFPKLDATIELDAYVYDGPIVPPEVEVPESTEELPAEGSNALGRTG
jgi:Tfp pilus assembly protein PilO